MTTMPMKTLMLISNLIKLWFSIVFFMMIMMMMIMIKMLFDDYDNKDKYDKLSTYAMLRLLTN